MENVAVRAENIPMQVITIKFTKENHLHWTAAIKMGIAGRGHIKYISIER